VVLQASKDLKTPDLRPPVYPRCLVHSIALVGLSVLRGFLYMFIILPNIHINVPRRVAGLLQSSRTGLGYGAQLCSYAWCEGWAALTLPGGGGGAGGGGGPGRGQRGPALIPHVAA
jgi:hypothetical protein